jgi:nucleotide-binding universal stress UspA family protein
MMRILLATDGSGHGDAAVEAIADCHYPPNTEVRVISVVEPPYIPVTTTEVGDSNLYDQMDTNARAMARAAVDKAAARLRGKESRPLHVTTEVLSGSPKRVILEDAEAFGADLIVVGSHGHGMLERFLLGSVSQAVALHANCSVEIVRSPKTQTRARQ